MQQQQTLNEEAIFQIARRIQPPEALAAYLEQACGADQSLHARVLALLGSPGDADQFLEAPPSIFQMDSAATMDQTLVEKPGTQIGPYKLLEQIGEGGMGAVYVAEQKEPVRRKVALKVIKPGMDTRQVVARFEAERQALAMMNHPNIAKVLDAGATEAGRPYFVMELVKGLPITEFCDRQRLDTRERLQLFITVCQAVQHAHQKGLIHRDIKPSNVMVEMHDVLPVPKVIDFGVAKAIGQQLSEKTLHTGFNQMVGTPLYMSPEQAGQSSIDVDTRSDVYSLGVVLYEILTGHTPFESETLRSVGIDEMRRMIREVDPPRPSARVSTLEANALSTVSDCRQIDPRRFSQQLRGELDWIVMKALDKDRSRRYESASALGTDVQRYLNDESVLACPPSLIYGIVKTIRRHKIVLGSGLLVVAALLVGLIGTTWQTIEARQARELADRRFQEAERERDQARKNLRTAQLAVDELYLAITDQWRAAYDKDTTSTSEVENQIAEFYKQITRIQPSDPTLLKQKGKSLRRLADLVFRQSGNHRRVTSFGGFGNNPYGDELDPNLREAVGIFKDLIRRFPGEAEYRVNLATTYMWIRTKESCKQAITLMQPLVATWAPSDWPSRRNVPGHYHGGICLDWDCGCFANYHLVLADAHFGLGSILLSEGDLSEAEVEFGHAVDVWETASKYFPDVAWHHWGLGISNDTIGRVLHAKGRQSEAEKYLAAAERELRLTLEVKPDSVNALASLLVYLGRGDEAISTVQAVIRRFPADAPLYESLGNTYGALRKWSEAYDAFENANRLSDDQIHRNNLALYLVNFPKSNFYDPNRALSICEQLIEKEPNNCMGWSLLGQARLRLGDPKGAMDALSRALDFGHPYKARNLLFLAIAHHQARESNEAVRYYDRAITEMQIYDVSEASIPTEYIRELAAEVLGISDGSVDVRSHDQVESHLEFPSIETTPNAKLMPQQSN